MNFFERLAYRFLRQTGRLKGHYLADLDWPQYWDKSVVSVCIEDGPALFDQRLLAFNEAYRQWREEMLRHGVTLIQAGSPSGADIVIEYGPLDPQHRGWTHAEIGPDKHVRQKTRIVIRKDQWGYEECLDLLLHEMGHALGLNGHSRYEFDVMGNGRKVLALTERDRATMDECYKLRDQQGGQPA
jgi:hypothetical protein